MGERSVKAHRAQARSNDALLEASRPTKSADQRKSGSTRRHLSPDRPDRPRTMTDREMKHVNRRYTLSHQAIAGTDYTTASADRGVTPADPGLTPARRAVTSADRTTTFTRPPPELARQGKMPSDRRIGFADPRLTTPHQTKNIRDPAREGAYRTDETSDPARKISHHPGEIPDRSEKVVARRKNRRAHRLGVEAAGLLRCRRPSAPRRRND